MGDFSIPFSPIDRSSKQKLNREILGLMDVTNKMGLTDTTEHFSQTQKKKYFFSAAHGTFFKTDNVFEHKVSLNRYKKIERTPWILSDHYRLKLDINNNRNNKKLTNSCKLNNSY